MLDEIMNSIHNWFFIEKAAVEGTFTIESGELELPFLKVGQYYMIAGSVFNDGIHQYGDSLDDETFTGVIAPMAVPKAFLDLVAEIEEWQTNNGAKASGPYQSESFGGYSYSKASGASGSYSWKDAFKSRLNTWRKI